MKIRTITTKDTKLNPAEQLVLESTELLCSAMDQLIIHNPKSDIFEDIANIINILASVSFSVINSLPPLHECEYENAKVKREMITLLVEKLTEANDIHFKRQFN